ncbi:MAG TPA: hypothetical protein VGM78_13245 [Ilumatobacteraceae bacterium]
MTTTDRVSATRRIASSAPAIFAIVTDPAMQVAIDGSYMLVLAPDSKPLRAVGDSFVIDMDRDALGDMPLGKYSVLNVVTQYKQDELLEWNVGSAERGPLGHVYGYELVPAADGTTEVTSYCDWSGISDVVRERLRFPIVPKMALINTLEKLEQIATR